MKKIILIILALSLYGCFSNKQNLVCSTISQDESTTIELTYTYGNNEKITQIQKTMRVSFDNNSLLKKPLNETFQEIKTEYLKYQDIEGLECKVLMNREEKYIEVNIQVDLSKYNFEEDLFALGSEKDYENITKVIDDISALGYYRCQE